MHVKCRLRGSEWIWGEWSNWRQLWGFFRWDRDRSLNAFPTFQLYVGSNLVYYLILSNIKMMSKFSVFSTQGNILMLDSFRTASLPIWTMIQTWSMRQHIPHPLSVFATASSDAMLVILIFFASRAVRGECRLGALGLVGVLENSTKSFSMFKVRSYKSRSSSAFYGLFNHE